MNFQSSSDHEILEFIVANLDVFGFESDDLDLPRLFQGVSIGDVFIIKTQFGFALAYRGSIRNGYVVPADLLLVFVSEAYRRRGEAKVLIDSVKAGVTTGVPINLFCNGVHRKGTFERYGFVAYQEDNPFLEFREEYEMRYVPQA